MMKRFILIWLVLISMPLMAAKSTVPVPELVYDALKNCYEKEKKREIELAKCIRASLKQVPNPEGYHAQIHQDSFSTEHPNKLTLIIYNQFGQILRCNGEAFNEISIDNCQLTQKKGLTPSEQLSIEPPKP